MLNLPNFSEEKDREWVIGSFKGADFEKIKSLFLNYDNVKIYDGIFPDETFENIKNIKLKFVHIDVDNYQSYKDSLSAIYENVVENGIIVFLQIFSLSTLHLLMANLSNHQLKPFSFVPKKASM